MRKFEVGDSAIVSKCGVHFLDVCKIYKIDYAGGKYHAYYFAVHGDRTNAKYRSEDLQILGDSFCGMVERKIAEARKVMQ
jgi:hypothetical protein